MTENTETPKARLERAKRSLANAVSDLVEAHVALAAMPEFYDQNTSPLGRSKHLRLAREGKIPHIRHGRSVLVRREDLDRYLRDTNVAPRSEVEDVDDMVKLLLGDA